MHEPLVRAHSQRYSRGRTPDFSHDRHRLILVSRGALVVGRPDAKWVLPTGFAAWIPAKTRCALEPAGAARADVLYLRPDVINSRSATCEVIGVSPLLRALVEHLVARESLPVERASRRLAAVLDDLIDSARAIDLRLPSPRHARAIQVAEMLMADPSDTPSLVALSRELAVSARTLARHFVADTGVTLGHWRRQFRLTHAVALVANGRPVKDVALEVGYESPSAFVAAFKRALGTTPARLFKYGAALHP